VYAVGHVRAQLGEAFEGRLAQAAIAFDALGVLGRLSVLEADRRVEWDDRRVQAFFGPGRGSEVLGALAERGLLRNRRAHREPVFAKRRRRRARVRAFRSASGHRSDRAARGDRWRSVTSSIRSRDA
jgi:hypothetical protein